MTSPSVCCICLTADRRRFTERALRCFLAQSYPQSWLLIYDTGDEPFEIPESVGKAPRVVIAYNPSAKGHPIGALRNEAIEFAGKSELIAHWDSDDWSDPERLTVQVEQIQSADAHAVGFHNVLFADSRMSNREGQQQTHVLPAAWEYDYKKYMASTHGERVVGASLVYWRSTWERQPFNEGKNVGEDSEWHKIVPVRGFNGVERPLLIAEVHGGNTSGSYGVFDKHNPAFNPEWRRAPEFDQYCRERLYP